MICSLLKISRSLSLTIILSIFILKSLSLTDSHQFSTIHLFLILLLKFFVAICSFSICLKVSFLQIMFNYALQQFRHLVREFCKIRSLRTVVDEAKKSNCRKSSRIVMKLMTMKIVIMNKKRKRKKKRKSGKERMQKTRISNDESWTERFDGRLFCSRQIFSSASLFEKFLKKSIQILICFWTRDQKYMRILRLIKIRFLLEWRYLNLVRSWDFR